MSHYNPDPDKSVNLTVDGIPVTVPEGTRILEAAKKAGVKIPTLCDFPDLCKRSVCRICVVECDGRSKLWAACANDVWEGVKVVTNNLRIMSIRKTILELLLADHPPECLTCVKNKKCELQDLAGIYGIGKSPFRRDAIDNRPPITESETIVRNMSKCVKCGRCVEVCQEIQTVRAINTSHRSAQYEICTPYGQDLSLGPCVFCGQCAVVCPVGAIYEHDETGKVQAALESGDRHTVAEVAPMAASALDKELNLPPGTITCGKIVTALKRIGFERVFDAGVSADKTIKEELHELLYRIKNRGKLPMVTSCSPGWVNFSKKFYPDLLDHLPSVPPPAKNFGFLAKVRYAEESGQDISKITTVSITPCIAKKYEAMQPEMQTNGFRDVDTALTIREIAGMIKMAGIEISSLPESPFDCAGSVSAEKLPGGVMEAVLRKVYGAYTGETASGDSYGNSSENAPRTGQEYSRVPGQDGIRETEFDLQGIRVKALVADGFANARIVMDAIRRGECSAVFVEVMGCPSGCTAGGGSVHTSINEAAIP